MDPSDAYAAGLRAADAPPWPGEHRLPDGFALVLRCLEEGIDPREDPDAAWSFHDGYRERRRQQAAEIVTASRETVQQRNEDLDDASRTVSQAVDNLGLARDFLRDERMTHAVVEARRSGAFPRGTPAAAAWSYQRLLTRHAQATSTGPLTAGGAPLPSDALPGWLPVATTAHGLAHAPDCPFRLHGEVTVVPLGAVSDRERCDTCGGSGWVYHPDLLPLLLLLETAALRPAEPLDDIEPAAVAAAFDAAVDVARQLGTLDEAG